jgi:hypothetical protein
MNVQLKDITVTARDGRVSHLEQVYIRGSHVRYFIVPDMLRYEALDDTTCDMLTSQERTHVQIEGYAGSRCRSCAWPGDCDQGKGQHTWRRPWLSWVLVAESLRHAHTRGSDMDPLPT